MLGELFIRVKDILMTEGALTLLRRIFEYVKPLFFEYGNYYLYEHKIEERDEADFLPEIKEFILRIIHTNEEADGLAKTMGVDFRRRFIRSGSSLYRGAVAFCIFVNGEIAHISWVALSQDAKNTFDSLPYRVDFLNKEVCTGGTVTVPKYRGKGLMTYGYFKRLQYLEEKGIKVSRNAVDKNNAASNMAQAKFTPRIYAEARYLKLLFWKYWRQELVG